MILVDPAKEDREKSGQQTHRVIWPEIRLTAFLLVLGTPLLSRPSLTHYGHLKSSSISNFATDWYE